MAQFLISGLAFVLGIASVSAQNNTSAQPTLPKKQKQAVVANSITEESLPAPQTVAPPTDVAPAEPPEKPLKPPVISWDGKLLTIDAENSTLSDILLAIRGRTGASIEMPGNTSSERVAVHLGPAPIREVISSLLYGTDFDYIIQASDTDPDGLRAVILTLREKDGKDGGDVVAGDPKNHMRLMKGYSAPGKRDFQVAHEAAEEAAGGQSDTAADATSSAPPAADPAATAQNSTAADSQPNPAPTSAPPAESADAGLTMGIRTQPSQAALLSSGQTSGPSDTTSMSQMQQNLQRMYEQRKQIQAQQNQGIIPASGTTP